MADGAVAAAAVAAGIPGPDGPQDLRDPRDARDPDLGPVRFEGRALGSVLRLTIRLPDPGPDGRRAASGAWDAVRAEFAAVDLALSRFRDDSELTRLNRRAGSGATVPVSWRLRRALAIADRAARLTDGRFDAGVLGALERIGERGAELSAPPEAPGAAIAPEPGSRAVAPPVPVDFGGVGKGLALRWARDRALAVLPDGAAILLDAGGDLVAAGAPETAGAPEAGGWRIGIEDPAAGDPAASDPLVVLVVDAGAVATSSVRVRRWVGPDGSAVHHLIDPRTGAPARTGLLAVTVAAPDPAWAEVWSKALFLAGRTEIAQEARRRGIAAWWIDDRGCLGMTPDARLRTAWADEARLG